jgi:4,5-DOPA dioxygenase extradiol
VAFLSREGGMLLGSGGVVHTLRRMDWQESGGPPRNGHAHLIVGSRNELRPWTSKRLQMYRATAPNAARAAPTPEHFDPIFVVFGAALPGDEPTSIHEGFQHRNLSLRGLAPRSSPP